MPGRPIKVLHITVSGDVGGIQRLIYQYSQRSELDNHVLVVFEEGTMSDSMKADHIHVMTPHCNRRSLGGIYKAIESAIDEVNPDVVIEHNSSPLILSCLQRIYKKRKAGSRKSGMQSDSFKWICYIHMDASDMFKRSSRLKTMLDKRIISRSTRTADNCIAISHFAAGTAADVLGVPGSNIIVLYNGVSISGGKEGLGVSDKFGNRDGFIDLPDDSYNEKNSVKEKDSLSGSSFVQKVKTLELIYVGRLIIDKGVSTLLKAISMLPDGSSCHLKVVGEGPDRKRLEAEADKLGLLSTGRVSFLGERTDVPDLLSSSGVFVHMPAWEEGFGITIAEAMSAGLICVCGRSGAVPEIIEDQKSGYIIDRGDTSVYGVDPVQAKRLADKLIEISHMEDDALNDMSRNAQARAQQFGIDKYTSTLDRILTDVIK